MNTKKLRVGIVGCGHWGKNYVRHFGALQTTQVSAVCDLDPERIKNALQQIPNARAFSNYQELLESNCCDAIVVSTIASTHFEIVKAALQRGIHVLAEKPLTLEVEQADELVQLSEKNHLTLLVAHTFLYNTSVRKIRQYITDGLLGDIYYLASRRTHLGLIREDVNAFWDLAPHDISMFLYFLGESPTVVQAMAGDYLREGREDVAFINLAFPSGIIGNITVSWTDSNKERFLAIVGSKARIAFDDLNNLEPIRIYNKGISVNGEGGDFGEFHYLLRDGDITSPKINLEEPLKLLCREFVDSVQTGVPPLSDGKFGRDVVQILCRIQQSLIKHKEMKFA